VTPPLLVLGVRRSGTTLLRVMLDRSSELAVPDESYVVPQLAHRHRGTVEPGAFVDDLRRLPRLRELGIPPEQVAERLRPGVSTGEAVAAVFETYAAVHGKTRWGDKTPLYMQHLRLLEGLFPDAQFVHLVRDGRDAAQSFLAMPEGIVTRTWAHPRDVAGFACQWRTEVEQAAALGARVGSRRYLEIHYETLVAHPEETLRAVCSFAALPYEAGMLDYPGAVDLRDKPHQQRLAQPPTAGVRDWRTEMAPDDVTRFESVAGDVLARLGYEVRGGARRTVGGRARLASYRVRLGAFNAVAAAQQRSPLWRRRHPVVPS
jgi:hypothetical protein